MIEADRFGLVLEYLDPDWLASVDWRPSRRLSGGTWPSPIKSSLPATAPSCAVCWRLWTNGSNEIPGSQTFAGSANRTGLPRTRRNAADRPMACD